MSKLNPYRCFPKLLLHVVRMMPREPISSLIEDKLPAALASLTMTPPTSELLCILIMHNVVILEPSLQLPETNVV